MHKRAQQAVILAAGNSTRTYPLTLATPKPLLPICGTPLICHSLKLLAGIGIKRVILIVGYRRELMETYLGYEQFGIELTYVHQREINGTGAALKMAQPHLAESPFLVLMGDDLYREQAIFELASSESPTGLAAKVTNPSRFGVFTLASSSSSMPTDLTEKPLSSGKERYVNTGAYFFTPAIWDLLNQIELSSRGEYELTDAIKTLIRQSQFRLVTTDKILGRVWQSLGYPWELLDAFDFLNGSTGIFIHPEASVADDVRLAGRIDIERGARIESGATLYDCYLGMDVWVGKKANLRSSIIGTGARIGEETSNEDRSPEENTVKSFIAGKPVDSNITHLGAIIGDYAKVGAEVHLEPGTVIWQVAHVPDGSWAKGLIL